MKQAYVNGEPISREAVQFELDRLVKFYATHGMSQTEIRKNLEKLVEKAQEQAIGAKLLLARAEQLDIPVPEAAIDAQVEQVVKQVGGRENFVKALAAQKLSEADFRKELAKGCRVDMLVQQACSGVAEPTEQEGAEYYAGAGGIQVHACPAVANKRAVIRPRPGRTWRRRPSGSPRCSRRPRSCPPCRTPWRRWRCCGRC